jgi:Ni/Fe-hydrogenase 1 B-type cytochrome subunit
LEKRDGQSLKGVKKLGEEIRLVAVWPPIIRLLHLLLAATMIILLLTGVLMHSGMILNPELYEHLLTVWHLPSGHVLLGVVMVRMILLVVRNDVAGWRALLPGNIEEVISVSIFYLSLARMQLPAYFAHNPLWKLLYLAGYILLSVQIITGLLLESSWLRSVFRTDSSTVLLQHHALLEVLLVYVTLHIITALLHDWKSSASEISSMINGNKYFRIETGSKKINIDNKIVVSLDSLTGKKSSKS